MSVTGLAVSLQNLRDLSQTTYLLYISSSNDGGSVQRDAGQSNICSREAGIGIIVQVSCNSSKVRVMRACTQKWLVGQFRMSFLLPTSWFCNANSTASLYTQSLDQPLSGGMSQYWTISSTRCALVHRHPPVTCVGRKRRSMTSTRRRCCSYRPCVTLFVCLICRDLLCVVHTYNCRGVRL